MFLIAFKSLSEVPVLPGELRILSATNTNCGGTISLLCVERDGLLALAVEADGQGCDLPKHHVQALSENCEVEELNPTNIASYFLQCLVKDVGGEVKFDVDSENGIVKFTSFLQHFNQNLLDD